MKFLVLRKMGAVADSSSVAAVHINAFFSVHHSMQIRQELQPFASLLTTHDGVI